MDELENIILALYSNCKTENELFITQVEIMRKAKILKDKRKKKY